MVSVSAHVQWWDHTFLVCPYRVDDKGHILVDLYLEICYESDRYLTTAKNTEYPARTFNNRRASHYG